MNWLRGLFRAWVIASFIWMGGYVVYVWHTCAGSLNKELWCLFGDNDWTERLSDFGLREYSYHATWLIGPPILVLIGGIAVRWIVLGFRRKSSI